VNTAGERALLHRLGASAEAFAGPLTPPAGATHLHVGAPFAVPNLRRKIPALLKAARRGGAVTSLDTQWDNAGRWMEDLGPSMPFIDFLFVNRFEARMLTGCDDAADAARRFRDAGVRNVVVKLGPDGCALFTPDGDRRWPAFRVGWDATEAWLRERA
jgi:sugar/nucleoside kinase (ribokinase family)